MVMNLVRGLCNIFLLAFFLLDDAQLSIALLSFWSHGPINTYVALIYSAQFMNRNKRLCTVGELTTWTAVPFSSLTFSGFHNQSALLTMVKCNLICPCKVALPYKIQIHFNISSLYTKYIYFVPFIKWTHFRYNYL